MNQAITDYLIQQTRTINEGESSLLSAQAISEAVGLNRSTVSGYLNHAYQEGILLKIREYPVLFLHRETFQHCFFVPRKTDYSSLDELLEETAEESPLASVIGAKGSLKGQIEQIKTAVLYPGNGLPIMICGASGSGKSFLAHKIYDYAVQEGVVKKIAPFVSLNCAQYFNNPELLSSILFGYTKGAFTGAEQNKEGLLHQANQGFLFLDEVHRLTSEGQEKLFSFMDTGKYTPVGDDGIEKQANVRLIFATTEDLQQTFLPTFLRRLPVIVGLPIFKERSLTERASLVDSFFLEESNILEKELSVSRKVIHYLQHSDFEGNVGKIKNIIKYACGSAYARDKKRTQVNVSIKDLPRECLVKLKDQVMDNLQVATPCTYLPHTKPQNFQSVELVKLADFFTDLLADFLFYEEQRETKRFIDKTIRRVTILMDEFTFRPSFSTEESLFTFLTYHIRSTLKFMTENYGFEQDGHRILVIANFLYLKENQMLLGEDPRWLSIKPRILQFLDEAMGEALWFAKRLLSQLASRMECRFLEEDLIFITFYLYSLNITKGTSKIKALVLAHGYTTASSMANVANRMLKKNLFQAFDMPLDSTISEIEDQVIHYIENYHTEAGLILLIDMGSLNQLSKRLINKISGPLLMIDSVSTPLLLEIGQEITQGRSIIEISETFQVENRIKKQFILPERNRKKVILTCCYTGMGSAIQIQEILTKSLDNVEKEIVVIPYDYQKLRQYKKNELPFQIYDVLAIIGTEDPEIDDILYIGLEELITGDEVEKLVRLVEHEVEIDAMKLRDDLIFNFSLKKMIENLVILDVEKVLALVKAAIERLEKILDRSFNSNRRFLLYLHCCCMVERILRKENIDPQEDIKKYKQMYQSQMAAIKQAFQEVERAYTIELSDLEVRLIHEIISNKGE